MLRDTVFNSALLFAKLVPPGRDLDVALEHLEYALQRANTGIAQSEHWSAGAVLLNHPRDRAEQAPPAGREREGFKKETEATWDRPPAGALGGAMAGSSPGYAVDAPGAAATFAGGPITTTYL